MHKNRHRPRFLPIAVALVIAGTLLAAPVAGAPPPGEYRSIDGWGNNETHLAYGAAGENLKRLTTVGYADLVSVPAGTGLPGLPGPRKVSNAVNAQPDMVHSVSGLSDMFWQWGQFLDHDMDLSEPADPEEPFFIPIPPNDPFFGNIGWLEFYRSDHDTGTGTGAGDPRQQVNAITAFIDASQVYGSDPVRAAALRTNDGTGRLRTSAGDLLPYNVGRLPNAPDNRQTLFLAGDVRANEQVALTALHIVFVREHNRLAAEIAADDPSLPGDEIYQRARRIVGALMQAITFREFLPLLLGPGTIETYAGYQAGEDPSISNVFSTAAYRIGHSMVSPTFERLDANGDPIPAGHLDLADAFFRPDLIVNEGGIDPLLRGLLAYPSQEIDVYEIDALRNFLFGPPGAGGFDLAALNIQRGRDHGLPGYNQARADFLLPPVIDWSGITSDPVVQARLASVYAHPNVVDVWVGGLAEDHAPLALVGTLFRAVLKDQFERVRDGDRFWYEGWYQGAELAELEATTLADVIARNTGIGRGEIGAQAFVLDDMADLGLSVVGTPDMVMAGDTVRYELSVVNRGPYPTALTLTDHLPEYTTMQSVTMPPDWAYDVPAGGDGTIACRSPMMSPGDEARLVIEAEVEDHAPANMVLHNVAEVAGGMRETTMADNIVDVETIVVRARRHPPGDCNADSRVDAGDVVAVSLAVFEDPVPGGDGCDANLDTRVDAADLSCTILLIFQGPGSCGAGS